MPWAVPIPWASEFARRWDSRLGTNPAYAATVAAAAMCIMASTDPASPRGFVGLCRGGGRGARSVGAFPPPSGGSRNQAPSYRTHSSPQACTSHLRLRDDGSKLDTPLRPEGLRRRPVTRRSCSPVRARRNRDFTLRGNHGLWMQIHKDRPALRMREGSERLLGTLWWSALQTASVDRYLP